MIFVFKSQFDAEFRRWSMKRAETRVFDDFHKQVEKLHQMKNLQFLISYIDPRDNDLLPINNDDNFIRAISTAKPILRIIIQRKGKDNILRTRFYGQFAIIDWSRWQPGRNDRLWNDEATKYYQQHLRSNAGEIEVFSNIKSAWFSSSFGHYRCWHCTGNVPSS